MNNLYINRILYKDIPSFLTKNSRLTLSTIWHFITKPAVKGHEYIFCYTQEGVNHYIMRTPEGFYYLYTDDAKSCLYPTLDFLVQDYPIYPGEEGGSLLDIFNMDKYDERDIPIEVRKMYVVYRTPERFYYAGLANNKKTVLFPTIGFLNNYLGEL